MPAILSAIAWFFRFFIAEKAVNLALKFASLGWLVTLNVAIMAAFIAYGGAVLKLILFVYEKTNQLIDFVNGFSTGGDTVTAWVMDVIKTSGIWNAFVDVYHIFSVPIVSIFVIFAAKLGLKIVHGMRNTLVTYFIAKMS